MAANVTIKMSPEQFDELRELLREYREALSRRELPPELLKGNTAYVRAGKVVNALESLK